jgi:hypothetical protein
MFTSFRDFLHLFQIREICPFNVFLDYFDPVFKTHYLFTAEKLENPAATSFPGTPCSLAETIESPFPLLRPGLSVSFISVFESFVPMLHNRLIFARSLRYFKGDIGCDRLSEKWPTFSNNFSSNPDIDNQHPTE